MSTIQVQLRAVTHHSLRPEIYINLATTQEIKSNLHKLSAKYVSKNNKQKKKNNNKKW